ncbi:hypothetical protein AB0J86_09040 [Micromonospora sp. NPDC049559]|uniref:hypothetical protein n=1 Tax=Micromonospora sp. NPDC049559 TaxID=3155923 RepID=UPI00343C9ED2
MSAETPLPRLRQLQREISGENGLWNAAALRVSTAEAVAQAAPGGAAAVLDAMADDYAGAATGVDAALLVVSELRRQRLPATWAGETQVAAGDALAAAERGLQRGVDALTTIAAGLRRLAGAVEPAGRRDLAGVATLREANVLAEEITAGFVPDPLSYDGDKMRRAHHLAIDGIAERVAAHSLVDGTAREVAGEFSELASEARLRRLAGSPLSGVDELLLTDAGTGRGPAEAILTPAVADRAANRLHGLDEADQDRMARLLAGAHGPEHRAYLMRALAAGHDLDRIAEFDRLIGPYGADPAWLREHLDPIDPVTRDTGEYRTTSFQGAKWTQGDEPTCVAAATVTARARVDPLYALQLTTGGHPGDPAYDNRDAFSARLRDEQFRVYDGGRDWYQRLPLLDGMTDGQSETVADEEVGARTGADYENRSLDGARERRAVLPEIERAVDAGDAVPITTREGPTGHALLVVGHDGDLLQLYNPWGYTFWVRAEDFVQGRLDGVDPDIPDTPVSVRLPRRADQPG